MEKNKKTNKPIDSMEGVLQLYSGIFNIYHDRYCILANDILTVCFEKGGEIEGSLHLGVNKIETDYENLTMTLKNGFHSTQFKFSSASELGDWKRCFDSTRHRLLSTKLRMEKISSLRLVEDGKELKKEFKELKNGSGDSGLGRALMKVWTSQAKLSAVLNDIYIMIPKQRRFVDHVDKIENLSTDLKVESISCI